MKKIVFVTNNKHKLSEIRDIMGDKISILSLNDIDCHHDIEETGTTLEANSLIKAKYVFENYGYDCFADDTGLEIEALNGAPGVYSARYAGEECIAENNVRKVLSELSGVENRKARFRTVITLIISGEIHTFEGEVKGSIINECHGKGGFGYDPIFIPDGYKETFAEMAADEKNAISHRGRASKKLIDFLATNY